MVYEWVPAIDIGIVILIVGLRLNGGGITGLYLDNSDLILTNIFF